MITRQLKLTTSALTLNLLLAIGTTAQAQEDRIDEIIVTAQKRSENLQQVPIAITAFGEETIEKSRIQGLEDVASRTPGFMIGHQNPVAPELTIRGIGSTDREAGSDRSVVLFVDEVYYGRAGGSTIDFFDLERIEVLRGPQGTLFGKNVVGGALNIITKKPSDSAYAKLQTSLGNYGLTEFKGVFNQPLSDEVFAKISFSSRDRNGTSFNNLFDEEVDTQDSSSIRGQLRFLPNDNLNILLTSEYSRDQIQGISSKPDPAGGILGTFSNTLDPDIRVVSNNILGELDREIYSVSGRVDYDTEAATFTSLTSYRVVDFHMERDIVGSPLNGSDADGSGYGFKSAPINDEISKAFSQEFRLSSLPDSGRLTWVAGLYFLVEDTSRDQIRDRALVRPPVVPGDAIRSTISRPLFDQNNKTTSYAVFGQGTYALTDRFNVTLGGRYTIDKKSFDLSVSNTDPANTNSLSPAAAEFSASASDTWKAFTPKATLDYAVTDDILAYASVSRGFKSGGFTGIAATQAAAEVSFQPEFVWSYEAGLKSQLFDHRLQLNLSGFMMDFFDLQLRQRILLVPGDDASAVIIIFNAAQAEIKGIEAEYIAKPFAGLTLSGSYAYTDSEVTESLTASLVGTQLPRAPKNTFTQTAEYVVDMPSGASISLRGDFRYRGEHFFDLGELAAGREEGFGLLDGRVSFDSADGAWTLSVWGKNILDKEYRTHVQSVSDGAGGVAVYGEPATYGATVTWRYN